jgi:UDP-N-acetylglucosamine--N-acetylmuramyl-(pentapeptide) pyrophosphoryl-undecaprenol N-acetylglucosamine transferase
VVCRAGALTVAELAVTGRPSLLIPLPYAIDDHQTANARFLADAGAGVLLPQDQLEAQLASTLNELLEQPSKLAAMAARALELGRPEATRAITDCAVGLLR